MIQNLFFSFFFFFRGVGSLSQPRLNIFTVGNMGVMICLGQGGLRSLSASSFIFKSLLLACPTHTNPPGSGIGTRGILFEKHIYKSKQLYLLHNEVGSNTQHNLLHNEAGSNTQHIFFTLKLAVTHSISSSQ